MGRYANNSYQGEILSRALSAARKSRRPDVGSLTDHAPLHKLSHRLTPEEMARLAEEYKAGKTTTQLEVQFQLSHGSVVKLLQDQGVTIRSRGLSQVELEQIVECYESGLSIVQVAQKLGRADSTIWRALLKMKVKMRPRGRGTGH